MQHGVRRRFLEEIWQPHLIEVKIRILGYFRRKFLLQSDLGRALLGRTRLVVFAECQWSQPAGGGRSLGHKGVEGPGPWPDASPLPELVSHLG